MTAACASDFVPVSEAPAAGSKVVGRATGTACGSMLIYASAYNFIPVLLNSRVERARERALASVPGASALTNTTVSEYWYFWVIGRTLCTTLEGDAVQ